MGAETGESVGVDVALILIDSEMKTERQSSESIVRLRRVWFELQSCQKRVRKSTGRVTTDT